MGRNSEWDSYWRYSQRAFRFGRSAEKVRGVTRESVSCEHCQYVPQPYVMDPRQAFKNHTRRQHPALYYRTFASPYVIKEEDDLAFND